MHFEILTEDKSGEIALNFFVDKVLGGNHSFRIHPYKGIGHLPKKLKPKSAPSKRILLDQLPQILAGFGKSLEKDKNAVVVVVDLDDKELAAFKAELEELLGKCDPAPTTLFCFAIEEMEAWLLGDKTAILTAYPKAKQHVLELYCQDSICGTWELMADALYHGGAKGLKDRGWPFIGEEKCKWTKEIAPLVRVEKNISPSFKVFCRGLRNLSCLAA